MKPLTAFLLVLSLLIGVGAPALAYGAWFSALVLELLIAAAEPEPAEPGGALISVRSRPPHPED